MKLTIRLVPSGNVTTVEVTKDATVLDLLKKMKLKPDTVIVTKDNMPIPVDDSVGGVKTLTIIQVASGG